MDILVQKAACDINNIIFPFELRYNVKKYNKIKKLLYFILKDTALVSFDDYGRFMDENFSTAKIFYSEKKLVLSAKSKYSINDFKTNYKKICILIFDTLINSEIVYYIRPKKLIKLKTREIRQIFIEKLENSFFSFEPDNWDKGYNSLLYKNKVRIISFNNGNVSVHMDNII